MLMILLQNQKMIINMVVDMVLMMQLKEEQICCYQGKKALVIGYGDVGKGFC